MKNFKRKLARLFGLALRSDLVSTTDAFRKRDDDAKHYYGELITLVKGRDFTAISMIRRSYEFKIQMEENYWKGRDDD